MIYITFFQLYSYLKLIFRYMLRVVDQGILNRKCILTYFIFACWINSQSLCRGVECYKARQSKSAWQFYCKVNIATYVCCSSDCFVKSRNWNIRITKINDLSSRIYLSDYIRRKNSRDLRTGTVVNYIDLKGEVSEITHCYWTLIIL